MLPQKLRHFGAEKIESNFLANERQSLRTFSVLLLESTVLYQCFLSCKLRRYFLLILPYIRPSVVSTLASIHEFVLQDCHHIPWAGCMATGSETKSETKDSQEAENEGNESYARNLLLERIALANRQVHVAMPNEVFVGPTTYDRFLHCFLSLLKKKEGQIKNLLNDARYLYNELLKLGLKLMHCNNQLLYGFRVWMA